MRFFKKSALAMLAFLSACGSTNYTIPYDRVSARVQTIGLVTPAIKPEATAALQNGVGMSFGLIGALAEAAAQSNRESRLNAVLQQHRFLAAAELNERLRTALEARGYRVVLIPTQRSNMDFLKTYQAPATPVDAYLDVSVTTYGYVAAGRRVPYRPAFEARMQLVSARDNTILMREGINQENGLDVQAAPEFNFDDSDVMVASPERTILGMRDVFTRATQAMAGVLQ